MKFLGASLGMGIVGALLFFGCSSDPAVTGVQPRCGNGYLEGDEVCDSTEVYCSNDCTTELGRCGDGIVQADFGEQCDPAQPGEGGVGGGGGAGGAGSAETVGCGDECRAKPGYVCESSANVCGQTGVDPSALVSDHLEEVCEYFIALWGGEGSSFTCSSGGDTVLIEAGTVEDCVSDISIEQGCRISELEEWTNGKSRCEIATGTIPCVE